MRNCKAAFVCCANGTRGLWLTKDQKRCIRGHSRYDVSLLMDTAHQSFSMLLILLLWPYGARRSQAAGLLRPAMVGLAQLGLLGPGSRP